MSNREQRKRDAVKDWRKANATIRRAEKMLSNAQDRAMEARARGDAIDKEPV